MESWIDNVGIAHSNSNSTRQSYKFTFQRFCSFIGKTPEEILEEYEDSEDRVFRRKYAQYIRGFISSMLRQEFSPNTIGSRIAVVKSFFKYNDLPLGHVPTAHARVLYHNRDITHEEINLILNASRPRERAFFALMAQSGLRPNTICLLRFKNIKEDFTQNRIPCKIDIPQEIAKGKYHSYFTFIGEEATKYLQSYLVIRPNIADEDYIFLKQGTKEKVSPKSLSKMFAQTVQKLRSKGLMDVKQKSKSKPRDIRLYNLRKWFRKHAHQAGFELVQFWMGHIVGAGQEEHYRPTDVEFHRKLYAEKAMSFLRFEEPTPTELTEIIKTLEKQHQEEMETIRNQYKNEKEELENRLAKIESIILPKEPEPELPEYPPEYWKQLEKEHIRIKKWEKEHPEELKKRNARVEKQIAKYQDEQADRDEILYRERLEAELDELRDQMRKLHNIVKQGKK